MKIVIERGSLLEGLTKVNKACTGKGTVQELNGILLQAAKGRVMMVGSDLDLTICTVVPCETTVEGKTVIDAKMLTEIVRKLPNGEVTLETTEDGLIQISCGKSVFNIVHMDAEKYPNFNGDKEAEVVTVKVPQNVLREMIQGVAYAVAQDESRPILQGVLFEIKCNELNLVALDGYRLAVRTTTNLEIMSKEDVSVEAVVNGKNLMEISKVLDDSEEEVTVTISPNKIMLGVTGTKMLARLMEGKFVNYRSLIPQECSTQFEVKRTDLIASLERASLMAKDGQSNLIKYEIANTGMLDNLTLLAKSQVGKGREELPITITKGEGLCTAFNSRYWLEMLKNMTDEIVICELTSPVAPCIVTGKDNTEVKNLVLPVRVVKE